MEQHREEINALCRKYGVRRLELFGSAASGEFDPTASDLDFFVEFISYERGIADRWFGLGEDLEALFQRKVDLVSARAATNRYFLEVANRHRVALYAA
ncbi:MAG: nucleotidyltransferase domain-containing protein [Anaerolineae bacterium]|nr:nucleotidyltransferase domain-containing protein [Phycisphaerae bacterium]